MDPTTDVSELSVAGGSDPRPLRDDPPFDPEATFYTDGINRHVIRELRALGDQTGKTAVDVPAGLGGASWILSQAGARVHALDLFPEFLRAPGIECRRADMGRALPLEDACCDLAVCQEGIEHVSDQLALLGELNRVLKPGGRLLLTTPNASNLRARIARLLLESDTTRRMPPSEIDGVWFDAGDDPRIYYGHLFLIGVHRLLTFARLSGFRLERRVRTDWSWTSLLTLPLFLPPILALTWRASWRNRRRFPNVPDALKRDVFGQHARLNCALTTLACKHVFWVLRKEADTDEVRRRLKELSRVSQAEDGAADARAVHG